MRGRALRGIARPRDAWVGGRALRVAREVAWDFHARKHVAIRLKIMERVLSDRYPDFLGSLKSFSGNIMH